MKEVEDVDFQEVEEVNGEAQDYKSLPKETKESIDKIQGKKSVFENTETNTYLLGAALGGGVGLVSCCDIVVATERAKFGLTEVRLGIVPAVISPFVVAKIGVNHARRYFVTGEIFDAHTACSIGLVSEVVADDEALDAKVNELVTAITANGPIAVKESKKLITEVTTRPRADAFDYAVQTIARLRVSEEGQEGLSAFLEKRKPGWQ